MALKITIEVWRKGKWFVAKCPELDFASQGKTHDEAKKNLLEVIQIQFEEMHEMKTLDEYLDECGYKKKNKVYIPSIEMVSFEKHALEVA